MRDGLASAAHHLTVIAKDSLRAALTQRGSRWTRGDLIDEHLQEEQTSHQIQSAKRAVHVALEKIRTQKSLISGPKRLEAWRKLTHKRSTQILPFSASAFPLIMAIRLQNISLASTPERQNLRLSEGSVSLLRLVIALLNLDPNQRLRVPGLHKSESTPSSSTVTSAVLSNSDPHQRMSAPWLHKSGASRIPQPASPSSTVPSYTFSLWRHGNGEINVPHLSFHTGSRYSKVHSSPFAPTRCWPPAVKYPLTPELEAKVRIQLKQEYRDSKRGDHCRAMKDSWRTELGIFRLDDAVPRAIHRFDVSRFCNKATTFYWAASALRYGGCPGFIFGAIYKAWFRYYNDNPILDHNNFLANLVKVTTTGPKSVTGIVQAHRLLGDEVASLLMEMKQESILNGKLLPHYQLQQLFRAIIVIYDEFIEPYVEREPRVRIFLEDVVRRQNVLLVLTGDNHGLSAPISFDSIRSKSLPTAQEASDEVEETYDMIRVPLDIAIQFILDLQQREYLARSCPGREAIIAKPANDSASSDASDHDAAKWAESIIQSTAHSKGKEDDRGPDIIEMEFAVEMIAMRERGEEIPPTLGVDMIEPLWE
ncbi:MAG: hypothetical protein Q9226_003288 [Calogaya cf. arnoldii]